MAIINVHKKIASIQFGLVSPKIIKKMAAAKVVTPELYDREGYPVEGGLMDTRLGVIDPGLICKTDGLKLKETLGHFGYIELGRPVIHISYVKAVHAFLTTTCSQCSRLLLPEEKIQRYTARLESLREQGRVIDSAKLSKFVRKNAKDVKKCPHCGETQIKVKIEKPSAFYEETARVTPIEIQERFERITDEDSVLLGVDPKYARPEWMILSIFPIPPVTMRPSITLESGERAEDDLTHKLSDIVRINQRLFENINAGAPEIIIEDLWDLLQYHVTTYFNNSIAQVPPARHRSGQPLKTITQRIKSKEGRFRHNLAGKRVNYAGRTVISPDPKIELNEVGVPYPIAMTLTIPERVTEWNIEWLKQFVKNGPKKYPGANYVKDKMGRRKRITPETQEVILEELDIGQIVERHLMDGDISIFNRQPSLHRMSIMCHKVRILPGKSFRLNPAVCNPYNADFDGDEMNLHIPQTEEARAEAEILMVVQTQIMSPKHGLNVIGCIEDAVTGNYLLTEDKTTMKKSDAVSLLISIGVLPDRLTGFKNEVTGKEVFSAVLPEDLNFVYEAVEVRAGKLVAGQIDPKTIGDGNGTLLRDIHRIYSEEDCVDIFGKIFKLGIAYLLRRGFTIRTADADIPDNVKKRCKTVIQEAIDNVGEILADHNAGKIKNFSGKTVEETVELKVMQELNQTRNVVGKLISKAVPESNNAIVMSRAGKGNILNLAQTGILVGQQALRGKRVERGYKNRTLALFKEGDLSPMARGFVRHSYKQGLNPVEFFFHAMTGRDSLMDTALRTPKSGYLYRRLANALQDLKVEYDETVRDANGTIVQFKYGDDNIDVSKSEGGTINIKKIIDEVKRL